MYRCQAIKKNGSQCRQCGKPQQSGGPILMGFCNYHKSQRKTPEYNREEQSSKTQDNSTDKGPSKQESTNKKSSTTIPEDIKSYLNKKFDKDEYKKLMKKYHPDKSTLFTKEKLTELSQIINEHKL